MSTALHSTNIAIFVRKQLPWESGLMVPPSGRPQVFNLISFVTVDFFFGAGTPYGDGHLTWKSSRHFRFPYHVCQEN